MISYAQNFEDVLLWRALKDVKNGFYVDVGAGDPVVHSVTKWFYDQGWSGINIEPNEEDYSALVVARPKDINLNLAVGPESGVVSFYLNEIKGWSTLDKATAKLAEELDKQSRELKVQSMPLREILRQYAHGDIHFLKIDVEGYEEKVISSGDFLSYRPWIVVLEFADLKGQYGDPANAFHPLVEAGYCLGAFDGLNLYYYSKDKKELAKNFETPANIFDDFTQWSEWDLKHQRDSLEKQVVDLTKAPKALQRQVENLEKQKIELTQIAQTSQRQVENLEKQRIELTQTAQASQRQVESLEKQRIELTNTAQASQRQVESLEKQRIELTNTAQASQRQVESLEKQRIELTNTAQASQRQVESLEKQRIELTGMVKESRKQAADLEGQRIELTEAVIDLQELMRFLQKGNTDLEGQRIKLTGMVEESRKQAAGLEGQRIELTGMLENSQKVTAYLFDQNEKIRQKFENVLSIAKTIRLVSIIGNPFVYMAARPLFLLLDSLSHKIFQKNKPQLEKVGIDLTPLLPGGINGGAKIFIIELIRQMAVVAPDTEFLLFFNEDKEFRDIFSGHANINLFSLKNDKNLPEKLVRTSTAKLGWRSNDPTGKKTTGGTCLIFCPFTAVLLDVPGVPVVSTFYDNQFLDYPRFFGQQELMERQSNHLRMLAKADGIATISNFGRDSILNRKEFPPESVRTIHLHLAGRAGLAKKSANLPDGLKSERYLFYPANFWPHKNHQALLVAFGMACRLGLAGDILLVMTGAEDARMKLLQKAVETMGLTSRVRFLGFLSDEDFANVLCQSLALFFPSLYEGFGIPVVEAQAAAVPVACANVSSLPEVVGEGAFLFNPKKPKEMADAMIRIATDLDLREQLVFKGRENAKRFSDPRAMAESYLDFFREIAARPRNKIALQGIFSDRWAGRKMTITNWNEKPEVVRVTISRPSWLRPGALWWGLRKHRWAPRIWRFVKQGEEKVITVKLKPGETADFKFSPCANPPEAQNAGDPRKLSCMVLRCVVLQEKQDLDLLA